MTNNEIDEMLTQFIKEADYSYKLNADFGKMDLLEAQCRLLAEIAKRLPEIKDDK